MILLVDNHAQHEDARSSLEDHVISILPMGGSPAASIAALKHLLPSSLLFYSLLSAGLLPLSHGAESDTPTQGELPPSIPKALEPYGPFQEIKTEPQFRVPILKSSHPEHLPSHLRNQALSKDHYFFTLDTPKDPGPWGPQILDSNGNLVFYSQRDVKFNGQPYISTSNPELAYFDPHPCSLFSWDVSSGEADQKYGNHAENKGGHLCVNDVKSTKGGHQEVIPRIYDSEYKEVQRDNFVEAGDLRGPDGHDFHMLPGGKTFLQTVTPKRAWDSEEIEQLWRSEEAGDDSRRGTRRKKNRREGPTTEEAELGDAIEDDKGPKDPTTEAEEVDSGADAENREQPTEEDDDQASSKMPSWLWVYDACFQEVDIKSRDAVFEWCLLDHDFNITESYVDLDKSATQDKPLDFAHINSVDKNAEGDYLISLKYLSQVMKIAGPNSSEPAGTPIWRLGGKKGTVKLRPNIDFSHQGHARFISANYTDPSTEDKNENTITPLTETISLFDNHCDPHSPPNSCTTPSSGQLILLNHTSHITDPSAPSRARLLTQYLHPHNATTPTGGNLQLLPNGNVHLSWGTTPETSEYDLQTGQLLSHTQIGASNLTQTYRVVRAPWTGHPSWHPKTLAYAKDCGSTDPSGTGTATAFRVWVSWNGATEVRRWKLWTSSLGPAGPWLDAGVFVKKGFETEVVLPFARPAGLEGDGEDDEAVLGGGDGEEESYTAWFKNHLLKSGDAGVKLPSYVKMQALDATGRELRNGAAVRKVWVPGEGYTNGTLGTCGDEGCAAGFNYREELNDLGRCWGKGGDGEGGEAGRGRGQGERELMLKMPLVVFVALAAVVVGIEFLSRFWTGLAAGMVGRGVYERVDGEEGDAEKVAVAARRVKGKGNRGD